MPKFLVIHPVSRKMMEANLNIPPEKNKLVIDLRSHCSNDAYWIRSINVPELEKMFCEWNAKDAESIQKILDAADWMTTEGIYEMQIVDAESFREKLEEITV